MDKEIVAAGVLIAAALVLIKLPDVLLKIRSRLNFKEKIQEVAEHPFICPNCGEVFHVEWSRLNGIKGTQLEMRGKAMLKCPKCNQTDWCRWTGKDDL